MSWKIIIVEDFEPDILLLERCFGKLLINPEIYITDNLSVFKLLLKQNPLIDLIICDYNLPEFTGRDFWEVTQEISPSTPFVYITGELNPSIAAETILAESNGYIFKRSYERLQGDLAQLISNILINKKPVKVRI